LSVTQIRQGLADALENVIDGQVSPYALAQPTPPGLQILPPGNTYDFTMQRGIDQWVFIVQGFVALTSDQGTQRVLDDMCAPTGSGSVKAALELDRTLGGVVDTLQVVSQSPGVVVDTPGGGSPMLLVEWRVEVYG